MPNIALSEPRVKALRSRPSTYDIRDARLRGFGVRMLPSGARRFFIHTQHRGMRVWKIVGDASAMTVDEARARAASLLAAIRCDADAPVSTDATRFETVAETVFQGYARVWKPQTLYVNRNYLRRQILPRFAGTMASYAVMNGVPVPVVSRMLGHSNVRMTLRYAHLADRDIEAAAERVGAAMARAMAL